MGIIQPKNNQGYSDYQYVTLEFSNTNLYTSSSNKIEEFFQKAVNSYCSIQNILYKDCLFNLLVYNFVISKAYFIIEVENSEEINHFFDYLRNQYELWANEKIDFYIHESEFIKEHMLLAKSAYVHTLTKEWEGNEYSSLRSYLYDDGPEWLESNQIKHLYGTAVDYYEYLKIYKNKDFLVNLKSLTPAPII